ncbi:MAG: transposase [Verrucomicrobiota bacterium]
MKIADVIAHSRASSSTTLLCPGTGTLRACHVSGFVISSLPMKPKRLPSPPYNPGVRDLVKSKREWASRLTKEDVERGFRGWHESGYLPHRDEPGLVQFVTFRLGDAFPGALRSEWEELLRIEDDRKRRVALENYLDLGRGECHLSQPRVASVVEDSLLFRHEVQYELRAWVVMPNHVHMLFRVQDVPMSELIDAWKGFTAKEANKLLGRKGPFWQEGYWDTYMRDDEHEARTRRYIENNPTKAKLIRSPKEWPRSSARYRDAYERLCLPTQ